MANIGDIHLPDDRSDLKTLPWRDMSSMTPPASDAGSIIGSNCSIAGDGDDVAISQTQFVKVAFTAIYQNNNSHHNGHKKLNRSQSEPRARYNKHNSGGSASLRYKTELCHPFEENGVCKYGEKCQFAHGVHELRDLARHPKYKTELCRTFHAEGYCPYGTRCHFIHEGSTKSKPSALCFPNIPSASSVKDLSLSPSSLSSLSPATSMTAFAFAAAAPIIQFSPVCSPPPSPTDTSRLPIFNEISAPTLRSFGRQFGGITA
ncbi:mRNA decay activator protein ZFP36L1 isoform X2 [Planococcus citri]|uniref:mRNA decay activator protein ZFP36L1 isoform X2 n=1 Tax=Planococcus citri TaxID=170843 RepID=UPI0031F842C3